MINKKCRWIVLGMIPLLLVTGCELFDRAPEATPVRTVPTSATVDQAQGDRAAVTETSRVQERALTATPTGSSSPVETAAVTPLLSPEAASTLEPPTIGGFLGAELVPLYTIEGHDGGVTVVVFSPVSGVLATGSGDGAVRLWRASDGTLLEVLEGHEAAVRDLSFSADGSLLASAGEDSQVILWDVGLGTAVKAIDTSFTGRALAVALSPDGNQVAVGGSKCFVTLYATWSGLFTRTLPQRNCSLKQGGSVEYWGLTYSDEGSQLIMAAGQPGGAGGGIQVRQVDAFTPPELIKGFGLGVRDLAVSPDRSALAVALIGSSQVRVVRGEDGAILHILEGHQYRVNSLAFSPDGRIIASGSRDGTVRLWDVSSGLLLRTLEGHTGAVNSVDFSPDGAFIASGSEDNRVIIWGLGQGGN